MNSFNLTPKKWIEATDAIGLVSNIEWLIYAEEADLVHQRQFLRILER